MAYRYKVTIVKNVAGFSGGAPNRGTSSSLLPYGGVHTHDFDLYKVVVLTRSHSTHTLSLSLSSARRKEVDEVRLEEGEEDPFLWFCTEQPRSLAAIPSRSARDRLQLAFRVERKLN